MVTLLQQLTRGKAVLLIIILGIGGSFQSGYHNTGLSSPSPFIRGFINSSWYHRYGEPPPAQTITVIWSLIVSMYAIGGVFGAFSIKFISVMLGRKKAMIFSSSVAIVAGVVMLISKSAKSFEMIIVARTLYGYSAALGNSIHMIYLGEISPRKFRGVVTLTSATFTSIGKLSGQVFGLQEILGRQEVWNIVLCVPPIFSMVQVIVLPFLPEAPRYLFIDKGDDKACKKALQSLWGEGDYKQEMDEMLAEQVAIESAPPKSPLQLLRLKSVRWQLITMSVIYWCNQLSGMSVVSIFAFDIFLQAGIPEDKIRYLTLGLGVSEILTYMVAGLVIDHIGRRLLFWGGYGAMSASWVLIVVTLHLKDSSYWVPYITTILIILFIIFFCGGPLGSTAALMNEIFIQSERPAAFVLTVSQRWMMFSVMGFVFPFLNNTQSPFSFLLFACMCLVGCVYTFFFLPETKGKTILEISEEFKDLTVCGKSSIEEKRMETKL